MKFVESRLGCRNAEAQMRHLLSACEERYGAADPRFVIVCQLLGWELCYQKRYAEAEEFLQGFVQHLQRGPVVAHETCQYTQHKLDSAISNISKAIDITVAQFGWKSAIVIERQILLERRLRECGKYAEAAGVRQRRLGSLRPLDALV